MISGHQAAGLGTPLSPDYLAMVYHRTRLDWSRRFARDPELLVHYEVEALPALSMAKYGMLTMAAMPLPQLSPEEASYLVVKHLDNRTRSANLACEVAPVLNVTLSY